MPLITGFNLDIDLEAMNHALHKHRASAQTLACLQKAQERSMKEIQPKVAYQWCDVAAIGGGAFDLTPPDGATETLTIGKRSDLMAPGQKAAVAVSTIGNKLEQIIQRLNAAGEYLDAYYLDCLGVAALAAATGALGRLVEAEARRLGWGVGLRLSPGSLDGWVLDDQAVLYRLAAGGGADVVLAHGSMLSPVKSATGLVGIGPAYTHSTVGSACRYCQRSNDCWRSETGVTG